MNIYASKCTLDIPICCSDFDLCIAHRVWKERKCNFILSKLIKNASYLCILFCLNLLTIDAGFIICRLPVTIDWQLSWVYSLLTASSDIGIMWSSKNMPVQVIERNVKSRVEFSCCIQPTPNNRNWSLQTPTISWFKDGHPFINGDKRITKPVSGM